MDFLSFLLYFTSQISCTIRATGRNRNIPIIVRVSDVNDNIPEFINTPYEASVAEVRTKQLSNFHCDWAID